MEWRNWSSTDIHPGAWPPAEWMELLRDAAVREDRAVIVVTHDSRVFDFADRIAYMDDGRIVKTEPRRRLAFAG